MKKLIYLISFLSISFALSAQDYKGSERVDREKKWNDEYASGMFKSANGNIFIMEDHEGAIGYSNIFNWLQGRAPGFSLVYSRTGTPVPFLRGRQAQIFVDEMAIHPLFSSSFPVSEIAMVKIINSPFAGSVNNRPAIAIYTHKVMPGDEE